MKNFEKMKSAMTPIEFALMLYTCWGCVRCPITRCSRNKSKELTCECIDGITQWLESEADDE